MFISSSYNSDGVFGNLSGAEKQTMGSLYSSIVLVSTSAFSDLAYKLFPI